ncbi:MAG: hypothetical protein HOV66_28045 [Streptomycetaceae bacterium]|nr:hypothetical protein [Streptomycetaceae bacterium]
MAAVPSVQKLTAAVRQLLDAHPSLTVYTSVVDPRPQIDEDGVVEGYAVLHPGAGDDTPSALDVQPGQLLWWFQVTCAGGDTDYAGWVVDTVRGLLTGKTLTVDGSKVGRMQPPPGYSPPMLTNTSVQPPRVSVPLQYQVLAVTA